MALKRGVRNVPIAFFSLLALASVVRGQTSPGVGVADSGTGAERLTYGVDAGLGETDNVTLAPNNKVNQTIATTDVDFDVKHQSRRYDVNAKGDFSYFDYLQGAFGSQLVGRFDGLAHFALIPQRLTWVLQDDFGQAALDPFVPVTPGNLENINYFSTGPDLALRVGGTGFIDMGLRYVRAQYATSPFNSNRYLATLGLGAQLSARSTVSLNGVGERVLFENTAANGDFDRESAYVRYEIQGARTGLSVDLGATKISQDASLGTTTIIPGQFGQPVITPVAIPQSAYSTTGPLARIAVSRKLSSAATLTLSGGRELTDASSSFSNIQGGAIGIVGTVPGVLTESSYTSDFASAGWRYERNRTTINVSGHWERSVYGTQPEYDSKREGGEFNLVRKLSRDFDLQVLGRFYKNNYVNATPAILLGGSPRFDDSLIGAALTWRHGRALEVRFRCEHSARTNTTVADNEYRENRIFLTVGYRPRPQLLSNDASGAADSPKIDQ